MNDEESTDAIDADDESAYPLDADEELETVKVGVIGAGRRMTPLLSRMLEYDYIEVRVVVDKDETAPGRMIAESLGVPTSGDVQQLLQMTDELDFVFCVNDDDRMRDVLIDHFRRTNNRRTMLFNELATRFIMSLTKDARELMQLIPGYQARRIDEAGIGY